MMYDKPTDGRCLKKIGVYGFLKLTSKYFFMIFSNVLKFNNIFIIILALKTLPRRYCCFDQEELFEMTLIETLIFWVNMNFIGDILCLSKKATCSSGENSLDKKSAIQLSVVVIFFTTRWNL